MRWEGLVGHWEGMRCTGEVLGGGGESLGGLGRWVQRYWERHRRGEG